MRILSWCVSGFSPFTAARISIWVGPIKRANVMDSLTYWRTRAFQARQRAAKLENPKLKAAMLRLAVRYNNAAARAAERQRRRGSLARSDSSILVNARSRP